jgi:hypothetical protein
LLLPERVYDELTPEELPYETPPVDQAIDDGWVRIVESIAYLHRARESRRLRRA